MGKFDSTRKVCKKSNPYIELWIIKVLSDGYYTCVEAAMLKANPNVVITEDIHEDILQAWIPPSRTVVLR